MSTAYLRPGEFRICPRCSSRQKGFLANCNQCGSSLEGAAIAERAYTPTPEARRATYRGLRVVLALGVLGAVGLGMALRNTFSSAAFDAAVASESKAERTNAQAAVMAAGPDSSVYERAAVPPPADVPQAWYSLATRVAPPLPATQPAPPATAVVEQTAYTAEPPAGASMVGIAPGNSTVARRLRSGATITNDDLDAIRSASLAPQAPTPLDDRTLVNRQRRQDAETALGEAQRKVETLQLEADTVRRQTVSDPALQEQQQRRLKQLQDDLEDAQKDVARAERKLREG